MDSETMGIHHRSYRRADSEVTHTPLWQVLMKLRKPRVYFSLVLRRLGKPSYAYVLKSSSQFRVQRFFVRSE